MHNAVMAVSVVGENGTLQGKSPIIQVCNVCIHADWMISNVKNDTLYPSILSTKHALPPYLLLEICLTYANSADFVLQIFPRNKNKE